jgi:hypothetical protein
MADDRPAHCRCSLLLLLARSLTMETEPGDCSVDWSLALQLPGPFPTANRRQDRQADRCCGARRGRGTEERQSTAADSTVVTRSVSGELELAETAKARIPRCVYLAGCGLTERRAAITTIGVGAASVCTTVDRPSSACQLVALSHTARAVAWSRPCARSGDRLRLEWTDRNASRGLSKPTIHARTHLTVSRCEKGGCSHKRARSRASLRPPREGHSRTPPFKWLQELHSSCESSVRSPLRALRA